MTPDQTDRLHLALTNMMLLHDGQDPITMGQLQEAAAYDPAEYANQRSQVDKLVGVVRAETRQTQPELRVLYETAAKGFHVSTTCDAENTFHRVSKFQSMADLHAFEDAWRAAMTAARDDR